MGKQNKASVPYDETLIEDLRNDDEAQIAYIQASLEENRDFPKAILLAIRHVAEARGFKSFAQETKLNRETLYKTLSEDGNPTFDSLLKMLDVLGLDFDVKPKVSKLNAG
jgi:probable addiction module antidote protein